MSDLICRGTSFHNTDLLLTKATASCTDCKLGDQSIHDVICVALNGTTKTRASRCATELASAQFPCTGPQADGKEIERYDGELNKAKDVHNIIRASRKVAISAGFERLQ